jgi:hypothetical protein
VWQPIDRSCTHDVDAIARASDLGGAAEFRQHLTTRTTGRHRLCRRRVDRKRNNLTRTRGDRLRDRVAFGTHRQSERRILDIATGKYPAIIGRYRSADREAAVRTIRIAARDARRCLERCPVDGGSGGHAREQLARVAIDAARAAVSVYNDVARDATGRFCNHVKSWLCPF